ncbi:MAG: hypothetical protein K0Q72_772 [Armatimonadetes bacterium]|jgi:hypothetical protein|nr:hypothetical protein [Armatimonadota bacterium]
MRWWKLLLLPLVLTLSLAAGGVSGATGLDASELAVLIDQQVDARLKAEHLPAAVPADDAEYLRRVYLDLHGVIPTAEQTVRFLSDTRPDRRARLVDALLDDPRYGDHLGDVWQGYLIPLLGDDRQARADRLRKWLAERFNVGTWDRLSTELLTATGKPDENPAVGYLIEGRLPRSVPDLTELTSRYFLGVRLSCAQCHNHPFVSWKQQDFWGMAAFFTQVQTPGKPKQVYTLGLQDNPALTLDSLKDSGAPDGFQSRPPTFLDGTAPPTSGQTTHRAALAAWLTSGKNPYFARAMANRTWWRLFGRGIVNPVDDMHSANPPSHPELLDLLARRFTESGFDHKYLTRAIVLSRAYQRTSRPGDAPETQAALFGRMPVKVLTPGQLYDSLVVALGAPAGGLRKGAQADPRAEFVQFFSDDADPDPTAYRRGIPHLLRQMNADQFAGRSVAALAGRLAKPGRPEEEVAADLFLTILSRRPTAGEQQLFRTHTARTGSLETAARELGWALLLTSEFSLNH